MLVMKLEAPLETMANRIHGSRHQNGCAHQAHVAAHRHSALAADCCSPLHMAGRVVAGHQMALVCTSLGKAAVTMR